MFGKVTQNVLGKWETVLGKWSDLLGIWSKLLGKRSDLLGKWSKFDGEMKQLDGEMKQNVLGRCPIDKVHTTPRKNPTAFILFCSLLLLLDCSQTHFADTSPLQSHVTLFIPCPSYGSKISNSPHKKVKSEENLSNREYKKWLKT